MLFKKKEDAKTQRIEGLELDERINDSTGLKMVLQDRIQQVMIQYSQDPDSCKFESFSLELLEANIKTEREVPQIHAPAMDKEEICGL